MDHEQLMIFTRTMPMKTIQVNGEDYLERYYIGERNGVQEWLHRFLRSDSERHLHSHPWDADSTILCGWYEEQVRLDSGYVFTATRYPGDIVTITTDRVHRIVDAEPNTWTHMRVYAGREPTWHFIDDEGNKQIMQTSPVDWWKDCKPRNY